MGGIFLPLPGRVHNKLCKGHGLLSYYVKGIYYGQSPSPLTVQKIILPSNRRIAIILQQLAAVKTLLMSNVGWCYENQYFERTPDDS